jgi:hypothetical protein
LQHFVVNGVIRRGKMVITRVIQLGQMKLNVIYKTC